MRAIVTSDRTPNPVLTLRDHVSVTMHGRSVANVTLRCPSQGLPRPVPEEEVVCSYTDGCRTAAIATGMSMLHAELPISSGSVARVIGIGIETADMLVHEVLSRPMRDRKAVARGACPRAGQGPDPGAGLTGSPDESGAKRREQGLARPAPGENRGPATQGSAAA